jgi:hypothetical protein
MIRALQYQELAPTEAIPGWAHIPEPISGEHYEIVDGRGWPLRALAYRFHGRGHGATTTGDVAGGIALQPWATGAWYDPRALPLMPIWPGLIVDTLAFASLSALVLDAAPALRRARRMRQGRCITCGYDLAGTASGGRCPECGTHS